MKQIANDTFHPAARVNALIIIGKLDSRRGDGTAGGRAAVPYSPAMDFLLDTVENGDTPQHLKIAAMVGILRHAKLQPLGSRNALDASTRNRLSNLARTLIQPPAEGASKKDGSYWLRRQGVQLIGNMRDAGNNGENAKAVAKFVADPDEHLWLRVDALDALANMQNLTADQVNPVDLSKSVGRFVATQSREDATFIEDSIRSIFEVAKFLDNEDPISGDANDDDGDENEIGVGGLFDDKQNSGAKNDEDSVPEVLPVFRRQLVRSRIKTVVFHALEVLKGSQGLVEQVKQVAGPDSDEAKYADALLKKLNSMMEETNIVDTRARRKRGREEQEQDDRSRAEKLRDVLVQSADSIEEMIKVIEPEPPEAPEGEGTEEGAAEVPPEGSADADTGGNTGGQN